MTASQLHAVALAWARVDRTYNEATRGRTADEPPSGLTEAELEALSRKMDDHDEKLFAAARALISPDGTYVGESGLRVCDACGAVENGNINCIACVERWYDDDIKARVLASLRAKERR